MNVTVQDMVRQVPFSLRDPRKFARILMMVEMPRSARWQLLGLAVVIGVALTQLNVFLASTDLRGPVDPIQQTVETLILERPIVHAMLQFSILVITVFMMFWVGRMARGIGGFGPAILMVGWIEFVLVVLRCVQAVIWLISPPLAAILGVVSIVLFFWLLSNFTAELHGFASPFWVFLGILGTLVGILVGMSSLMALVGVTSGAV